MGPQFVRDDLIMRVDGDVFEMWSLKYHERIPLAWLMVRVHAMRKNTFLIYIGSKLKETDGDQPLYARAQNPVLGRSIGLSATAEEEPVYREFFAEVAQVCGRSVAAGEF
jgi:hypothetical protein